MKNNKISKIISKLLNKKDKGKKYATIKVKLKNWEDRNGKHSK